MKRTLGIIPILLMLFSCAYAQQPTARKKTKSSPPPTITKKPLTHDVYDGWNDITEKKISANGQYFVYGQNPQEGDGKVITYHTSTGKQYVYDRGTDVNLSSNSEYAVFKIKPQLALVKDLRRQKKKKEELPKDSLGIVSLSTGSIRKYPNVLTYKVPEKAGNWLAYTTEKSHAKSDSTSKSKKKVKKQNEENGYELIIESLDGSTQYSFPYVKEYTFTENGSMLAFSSTGDDSLHKAGVYVWEMGKNTPTVVYQGHSKHKYTQLSFAKTNNKLAWIADLDTNSKTQVRLPKLFLWKTGDTVASMIVDENNQPGPSNWLVNGFYKPTFSQNGEKLFFGTNPKAIVADTTLLPEEVVNVEVWHWKDKHLQTQQKVTLDRDRKKAYLAVYHVNSQKSVQLGTTHWETIELVNKGDANFVLAKSTANYSHEHWDWNPKQDVATIDLSSGKLSVVKEKLEGNARTSPKGKYVYWFSNPDSAWFAYDTQQLKLHQLTSNQEVSFTDETDDHPDFPRPYGLAGWTENDAKIVIYDRYDLWEFAPGATTGKKLTDGRATKDVYRYVSLDPEADHITISPATLVRSFNEKTRRTGFYQLTTSTTPKRLYEVDAKLGPQILKAKDSNKVLFTQETFKDYPNWYLTSTSIEKPTRITDANPQQAEYSWGSVEHVNWKAGDGTNLEGLLYKPENFDPSKKYPLMVYYYEKNADNIHSHFVPKPIRSYINFSYFASNEYLIFVPDIVYQIGHPGKSAYNCLIPGVLQLINQGFVDEERIGISGHSWGGYQTAYLITETNLFKAAEAGAPVVNMTSAYGGIRWDSGLTRQAQYERTQSRIGGTLWEKPFEYIENSPLFFAPKVQTPLLMMHNDEDGAVPWYQGIEFYMALKRLNKPVWMLNYNGEKHGLGKRQNMKDFTIRLYQYFDHYLKDAPAPAWMTEGLPMIEKGINQRLTPSEK